MRCDKRVIMDKKIFQYLSVAANMARKKKDQRTFFLGAVGIRKDGAFVQSFNAPSFHPTPCGHAETRLARKLDRGAIVYVARVRADGSFGNAKPCANCEKVLRQKGVKKIYYSLGDEEYGVLHINKNYEPVLKQARHL